MGRGGGAALTGLIPQSKQRLFIVRSALDVSSLYYGRDVGCQCEARVLHIGHAIDPAENSVTAVEVNITSNYQAPASSKQHKISSPKYHYDIFLLTTQ